MERRRTGDGTAVPPSSPDCRRDQCRPTFGRPRPAATPASPALPPTAASFLAAHTPGGGMTMSRKTFKLMVAGVFVAGAFGIIALGVAWATPPSPGFVSTPLAGPALMDEIQTVHQTPDWGVMIKTRGLSDVY